MDPLSAARAGFATVQADAALKDLALANLGKWLSHPDFAAYRPQLEWMIAGEKWSLLVDSFYQVMPFGTGGRRGSVGIGPNRMNLWTLGASVQGHCEYLRRRFPGEAKLAVVLAFDVRQFEDRRGVYNRDLPNPVLHLSSREFCQYAAGVYAALQGSPEFAAAMATARQEIDAARATGAAPDAATCAREAELVKPLSFN